MIIKMCLCPHTSSVEPNAILLMLPLEGCISELKKNKEMRDKSIEMRVTEWEKLIIQDKAKRAGLSTSGFLRKLAFETKIKARLTPEEIRCYQNLKEYKSHFKRIANLIKKNDSTGVRTYVLHTIKLIQEHLKKFE